MKPVLSPSEYVPIFRIHESFCSGLVDRKPQDVIEAIANYVVIEKTRNYVVLRINHVMATSNKRKL